MGDIRKKRLMAIAGLFWLLYLIIHMVLNLQYFQGEKVFNGFYQDFRNSGWLYFLFNTLLVSGLLIHVYIALARLIDSDKRRLTHYKKRYPKGIPKAVAWSGVTILLVFIILHTIQMLTLSETLFLATIYIFKSPWYIAGYGLGLLALAAHLHHGLSNVAQSFGKSHNQYQWLVLSFITILIAGFASIPLSIILE